MCIGKTTYLASSNSSNPFSNNFSFLYCSRKAFRVISRLNWSNMRLKSYNNKISRKVRRLFIITHRRDACMVGKHQAANAMIGRDIWRLSGQSYLYGCRTPRYEIRKLPLPYSQERLMNLIRIMMLGPEQRISSHQRLSDLHLLG